MYDVILSRRLSDVAGANGGGAGTKQQQNIN